MTGLDITSVQSDVTTYITDRLAALPTPLNVELGGVPTAESLPFVNGMLTPYVVLRYTMPMPKAREKSFMGPTHDGYYAYVDALCIGPTATDALELGGVVWRMLVGKKFPNASVQEPIFGGGRFVIYSEANRQPVAFIIPVSMQFSTNIEGVGTESLVT